MTVSSSTRKAGPLSCNGSVTSFPFTFKCFTTADVRVILTSPSAVETDLVLNSTYTISLNADQNASPGGTVDTVATYASNYTITILSDLDMLQETDIQNQGGFYPEVIENALDKVTMMVQQVKEEVDRAVKVDASSSVLPTDYLTQAAAAATNAASSASAADVSATSASASASAAAVSAGEIVGFEWVSSWLTATAYLKNNLASESGNTYIALSDHTSGTFATDYSNGLWALFASKGAAGAGTGDLLAANNLSEVNPATARANLSAAASGANSDITSITGLTSPITGLGDNSKIQPITASVAANALTITLNPTSLDFRSSTLGSGTVNTRTISVAISLVVSSGSTLGTINAIANRLAVLAIDNAGTVELAVVNVAGGTSLDETGVITTVAEGGAGAADSATAIYSATVRAGVPYRVVGFVESTQATAGTWATAPSKIQGYGGQAFAAISSIGYGQTWQDVTGSRSAGTTYYNTTGKPIQLAISAQPSTTTTVFNLTIGGVLVFKTTQTNASYQASDRFSAIVPPNMSYVFSVAAGGITTLSWSELR